jgi:hypothetical protein
MHTATHKWPHTPGWSRMDSLATVYARADGSCRAADDLTTSLSPPLR